jgi:type IV secretory pathway VirD2 relaxase
MKKKKYFYETRITQSDYRGGTTNTPRKHPLHLDTKLPQVSFRTEKGKGKFLDHLHNYVVHFIKILLGEEKAESIKNQVINKIKDQLGIPK